MELCHRIIVVPAHSVARRTSPSPVRFGPSSSWSRLPPCGRWPTPDGESGQRLAAYARRVTNTRFAKGGEILARGAERLAHLERLSVRENCLTPAGIVRLAETGLPIDAAENDPELRYVSVSE
jgi:hypothetical protein